MEKQTKFSIGHYTWLGKSLAIVLCLVLFVGPFIKTGIVLISFFFAPFCFIFLLWTIFDKTSIEIKSGKLFWKERNRMFVTKKNFPVANIEKIQLNSFGFVDKAVEQLGPLPGTVIGAGRTRNTKAYEKDVLIIKTSKKVYKVGKKIDNDRLKPLYDFVVKTVKEARAKS